MASSDGEKDAPRPWRVWAKIVGPYLPSTTVRIGDFTVGPPPDGYQPPHPVTGLNATINNPDAPHVIRRGPTAEFGSASTATIRGVIARNAEAAINEVERNHVPKLIVALSVGYPIHPYTVQMHGADDGQHGTADFGSVVSVIHFERTELPHQHLEDAQRRIELLGKHEDLGLAAQLIGRGLTFGDALAGEPTMAASVMAYWQAIESCARVVEWQRPDDYEASAADAIRALRKALGQKSTTKKQVAAVDAAHQVLGRLDARYVSIRVDNAAAVLGLEKSWIEDARRLSHFRNKRLGHAGALPTASELADWLGTGPEKSSSAYALASRMLAAALEHQARRS